MPHDELVITTKQQLQEYIEDAVEKKVAPLIKILKPATSSKEDDELLSVKETAKRFKKSQQTIYNWIKTGKLKAGRLNGGIVIKPSDVMDSIKSLDRGGL